MYTGDVKTVPEYNARPSGYAVAINRNRVVDTMLPPLKAPLAAMQTIVAVPIAVLAIVLVPTHVL
jgi:hypothetical protein